MSNETNLRGTSERLLKLANLEASRLRTEPASRRVFKRLRMLVDVMDQIELMEIENRRWNEEMEASRGGS